MAGESNGQRRLADHRGRHRPAHDHELHGTDVSANSGFSTGNVIVASFVDANAAASAADYTASINWGDDHITTGTVVAGSTPGTFLVQGSNTYVNPGTYPLSTTITLNSALGGNRSIVTSTTTVAFPVITATGVDVSGSAKRSITNQAVATFTVPDPNRPVSQFTATINWGDGTTTAGTITGSNGSFQVLGTHTYATPGNFTVTTNIGGGTTAGDVPGTTATATSTATISAQSGVAVALLAVGAGPGGGPRSTSTTPATAPSASASWPSTPPSPAASASPWATSTATAPTTSSSAPAPAAGRR